MVLRGDSCVTLAPKTKKDSILKIRVLPFCFLDTTQFAEFILIPVRDMTESRLVRLFRSH